MTMTMKDKLGGYAFPSDTSTGMTLRDWFAGQALANVDHDPDLPEIAARAAYRIADAMLAARKDGA
jgi:hypothetical protein